MRIIAVDDEPISLAGIEATIQSIVKDLTLYGAEYIAGFSNPMVVLDFIKKNPVDLCFLDIEMPGMSGMELAKKIKNYNKHIKIVFITGYDEYAMQAFEVEATGYLLKPHRAADVERLIKKAVVESTYQSSERILVQSKIFARTFPRFDLFVDNKLVVFRRSKSKEMLAYLVDKKGSTVTMEEMITALWENREYDNKVKVLYREAVMTLRKTLEECGAAEMLGIRKGLCYAETSKFACDYYNLLQKSPFAVAQYDGQYLSEYAWAEETNAYISRFVKESGKTAPPQ